MKVVNVAGARPNFMKIALLMEELGVPADAVVTLKAWSTRRACEIRPYFP